VYSREFYVDDLLLIGANENNFDMGDISGFQIGKVNIYGGGEGMIIDSAKNGQIESVTYSGTGDGFKIVDGYSGSNNIQIGSLNMVPGCC